KHGIVIAVISSRARGARARTCRVWASSVIAAMNVASQLVAPNARVVLEGVTPGCVNNVICPNVPRWNVENVAPDARDRAHSARKNVDVMIARIVARIVRHHNATVTACQFTRHNET